MAFFENRTPDIINRWNNETFLVKDRETFYVCKSVLPTELDLYKKLVDIECPQIARIYGTDIVAGTFCIVQEYVPGVTLERYLEMHGKLDEMSTCAIAYDICDALEALHGAGIIHRDLTPRNLIITEEGTLKVIDFGISRMEKEDASNDTELLGTAGFAAPEQYGFSQTSPRSDIYSLGVLMNYMRTHQFPKDELADGELRPVIEKCTMMDEKDRYQSVAEVKEELLAVGRYYKTGKVNRPRKAAKKREPVPPLTKLNGEPFEKPNSLPGFRQNEPIHRIIASLYYGFAILTLFSGIISTGETLRETIIVPIVFFLVLFVPVLVIFNYLNWLERLPLTRGRPRGIQAAFQIVVLILDILLIRLLLMLE